MTDRRDAKRAPRGEADDRPLRDPGAAPSILYDEEDLDEGQETLIWDERLSSQQGALSEETARSKESEEAEPETTRALSAEDLSEVTSTEVEPPPAHVDPHAWFLGRSFGGFRIVCALASGGMATVFLGRKEGPLRVSKHAAIKVVHPHLSFEREFVDMFLDEARIAALLDHPNVCTVLDFGMAEGTYYLAMEYLLGETWNNVRAALAEHPDGARMLPYVTAYVLSQACEGLHAAHEAIDEHGRPLHIVHRDVSPQNIFVAYDGTVRVLDFGIASAADRITSTRDGTLKGRLAYMSPEQMSLGEIGPTADIWAVGVVLREALEGKRLFRRATDAETMLAVTHEPVPEWSVDVAPALRDIADRALARDPAARYQTAHDLAAELKRFATSGRRPIGASELSVWMSLLFAAEHEQKRALLQLPIPEPLEASGTRLPSATTLLEPAIPPLPPPAVREAPVPAKTSKPWFARPRWLSVPALLALGSIGAIVGLVLGRAMRAPPAVTTRIEAPAPGPTFAPIPSVAQLPVPAASAKESRASHPRGRRSDTEEIGAPTAGAVGTLSTQMHAPDGRRQGPVKDEEATAPAERAGAAEKGVESAADPAADPAPKTAAKTGIVLVAFDGGWAEVYLGRRLLGTTPGRFELPAGRYTLGIRPFGTGKRFTKRVEVLPGESSKLFLGAPTH